MDAHLGQAGALFPLLDAVTFAHRARIAGLARARRSSSIFDRREFAADGGLTGYGPNYADMRRRAAAYVDQILVVPRPPTCRSSGRRRLTSPSTLGPRST